MQPPNSTRTHFRALTPSDASDLYAGAFSIPAVTAYLQWDTHQVRTETQALVDEMISLHQQGRKYFWLAFSPDDRRSVGLGSIKPEEATAWVGFLVFHQEQRKGFGAAILAALESAVLGTFDRVAASVDPQNKASIGLLAKSGWQAWDCDTVSPLKAFEKRRPEKPLPQSFTATARVDA